jgi:RNA ligase
VDYAEDRLVLIAIRDNVTGAYISQKVMETVARMLNVECVKTFPGTAESMENLITHTRGLEEVEGWVVRFHDGHMVKIKADWYVRIHKTKDNLLFEKNVIDMIVNENMDDAKSFMLEDDRRRIEAFEGEFWAGVDRAVELYDFAFNQLLQEDCLDKKTYALTVMKTDQTVDPFMPGMMFGRFDAKDTRTMVLDQIRKNLSTQTKVDNARRLWGHARWSFQFEPEA